jgi:hypothetical protein
VVGGIPADEDAILMRAALGLEDSLAEMSPVHTPRGFTKSYIKGEVTSDLPARISRAHAALAERHELLLVEGTGHAGVGSVLSLVGSGLRRLGRRVAGSRSTARKGT